MSHEEHGCPGPLLPSFSVVFLFPCGWAGDMIAKHRLVLCVHLVWWGGGFVKDVKLQIQKWRGIFQVDFGVVEVHLLNCTKSLIQAKFRLRTASFYRLKFYCPPLIFKGWTLQWCELTRVFLGVSRHSVPLSEKLWKPNRDYIKLTSRKIKNTKTAGAKQLNRRRQTKEPVYEEVLPIPVRKAQ